jgi:hypothetical protein
MLNVYAECRNYTHYAECRYAKCRYDKCRYAKCRYAECRYAECRGTIACSWVAAVAQR